MNTKQSTRYQRRDTPPAMRFQDRDGEIIQAIKKYDGVLSRRQVKDLFWKDASSKTMERRFNSDLSQ